tara:strand:+ start:3554 stop:4429 length:876 start_codon:yes stop_codon:yes gene_type:complete
MKKKERWIPAKCILSGEHAVLRGYKAIAMPVKSLNTILKIEESPNFQVDFYGERGEEVRMAFWMAMEKALELVEKKRSDLSGKITIDNKIPVGSGLGASASLCVAVTEIMLFYSWLNKDQAFRFAKSLEDVFHGESSGLDIAVSLKGECILFHRENGIQEIQPVWQPNMYLTYSGHRGLTADCIKKVKELWAKDENYAASIDEKMSHSVERFLSSLKSKDEIYLVKEALDMGLSSFQDWNLVSANLREHMQSLRNQGALAMKPTGSGDGGYVLSLWAQGTKPQDSSAISLF